MPKFSVREQRVAGRFLIVACLLLFYALALSSALAKSPTNDEPAHILRAFALIQTDDLRFQVGHAPFSHRLIGVLLPTEADLPDVGQLSLWEEGERLQIASQLLWDSGLNVDRVLFLGRLPIIWLGLLLGALIGSWALSWHGRIAMAISSILFAVSPNLIAAAALATTDLVVTATYFATVYAWWQYWRSRRVVWWLMAAVCLGMALATKLTAVLLLPVLFLLTLLFIRRGRSIWRPFLAWLFLLPAAFLVVWLIYGFELGSVEGLPFAAPIPTYVTSWQSVMGHVERGHQAFFWGDLSGDGWWYYFPVAFLIKTPITTLTLLMVALGVVIVRRDLWYTAAFLLLPVAALFGAAMISRLNIGYRHILPTLPFLMVLSGTAVILLRRWSFTRVLLILGLVWYVISGLQQNPHYLAYFNEAVGGTSQGYKFLGDSNLDWGQDLKLLAETMADQGGEWTVSYAGVSDPVYYGIVDHVLIDFESAGVTFANANPPAGRYAISANHLHGLVPDADIYDWFRRRPPSFTLGGSVLVYDVEEQRQGQWVAQCLDPTPLLTSEDVQNLLGSPDLRHLSFDCQQAFVLADGGSPGWFILPQADAWWFLKHISPPVSDKLQLVYRHQATAGSPSFDVYYWIGADGGALSEGWLREAKLPDGKAVRLPYAPNEIAQLEGYQIDGEQWLTLWSVTSQAPEPLSLRAHLYTEEALPPLAGDSLGFSSEQWREGDRIIQRFIFPGESTAIGLETGMYNYQTLQLLGEALQLPKN
jgi:hypothetical protein